MRFAKNFSVLCFTKKVATEELFHTQVVLSLKIVKSDAKVSMDMGMKVELRVLDLVIDTISIQEFDKGAAEKVVRVRKQALYVG